MQVLGKSDIGLKRKTNQDCFDYKKISEDISWAVVCDGMGGVNGGDIASQLAVKTIKDCFSKIDFFNDLKDNTEKILKEAIEKANLEIYLKSKSDKNLIGMGTTIVLVLSLKDKVHVAHVGDSRAYLVSDNSIKQLTIDHSVVQELLNDGEITHEEAKVHPNRNIITRALGLDENVNIDYLTENKKTNDKIIICTDGLTDYFDENEILDYFKNKKENKLVDEFILTANERGGSDNITVVIMY